MTATTSPALSFAACAAIGVVPLHALLFSGSVHDNIACGWPYAAVEAVHASDHAAQAHDFITRLPQGYECTVGDQGIRLSAGCASALVMNLFDQQRFILN